MVTLELMHAPTPDSLEGLCLLITEPTQALPGLVMTDHMNACGHIFYFSFEGAFLFFFGGRRRHFLYYFWTFFRKQLVCKGPLYLLERGIGCPAPDFQDSWSRGPVVPWSHS